MYGSVRADEKGKPRAAAPSVAISASSLQSPVSVFAKSRGPPDAQREPEQEELLPNAIASAARVALQTDHMQLRTSAEADAEAARKKQRNVFIPVVCSIFGVIIFMRLGAIVGSLGLLYTWLVIGAAFVITLLTIGSVSALVSAAFAEFSLGESMDLSGSFFNIIRRALGRHLGQLIGVMLYVSFAVATSYYLLGFSEITMFYMGIFATTHTLPWNAQGSWVTVIIASTLLALLAFSYTVGVKASRRFVRFVFVVVMVAVACNAVFMLTSNPSTKTGLSSDHLRENVVDRSPTHVVTMFATFFPAFCGVLAGTNLAEDISAYFPYPVALASPASMAAKQPHQLVLGVHYALFFSLIVYVALSLVLAAGVDNETLRAEVLIVPVVVDSILGVPVVYLGIVFTTLSSALSNIMGGTSILAALLSSNDDGSLPDRDPASAATPRGDSTRLLRRVSRRARSSSSFASSIRDPSPYSPSTIAAITWVVSQAAILCGTVDVIIPLVSASFLLTFFVLNFACFFQEVSSRSFSPSFRLYSRWTALLGAILSLAGFFLVISTVFLVVVGVSVVGYATYYRHELPIIVKNISGVRRQAAAPRPTRGESFLDTIADEESDVLADLLSPTGAVDEDAESEKKRFELAAQYVRDAIHGKFLGQEYLIDGLHKTHFKRMYHALSFVRLSNMGILMLLTFFETPSWCFFATSCGDSDKVLTWGLLVLPQNTTITIELVCLSLLAVEMVLKFTYMGQRLYFENKWHVMQLICLLADFASVLIVIFVPQGNGADHAAGSAVTGTSGSTVRGVLHDEFKGMKPLVLAPLIRPMILLSMSHKLRSGFSSLVKALPHFIDGLLTIAVLIVIYAVFGMVLFEGTDEGTQYFNNFADACLNLLILLTTANFPDVMMPIYSQVRAGSLFFVSFLMVGQLLVMNLVFASVYQNYRREVAQRAMEYVEQRFQALQVAFQLLPEMVDGEERPETFGSEKMITRGAYERLVAEIKRPAFSFFHNEDKQKKQKKKAKTKRAPPVDSRSGKKSVGFRTIYSDVEEQDITFDQFYLLIKAFAARQKKAQNKPKKLLRQQSTLVVVTWMQKAVVRGWFDKAIDVLILGNLLAILIETQTKITGNESSFLTWELCMPLFTAAYLVEMLIKMYFYGFGRYFDQLRNVYDCVVTIIISIAEVSVRVHYGGTPDWDWVRFLLLLRFLRCLRLLIALKSLSSMFAIVLRLIPAFTTLYGMLGIVMAEYAAIGMQVFGGKLVMGDERLAGITYGTANYYSNNFNDFASSLVTLFELLIVNNWYVTMEGAETVTSKWSRIYFISFYIIGVVMVLSLVVAFVVEAYFEDAAAVESKAQAAVAKTNSSSSSSSGAPAASFSLNSRDSSSPDSPPPSSSSQAQHDAHPSQQQLVRRQSMKLCPRADSIYVEDFL